MRQTTQPIFSLLFLLALSASLQAQDPRFSQYYASPWGLNPAMTGLFNGKWRVTGNYRDQWNSFLNPAPFRTYAVAFDLRAPVNKEDYAAFGIGVMNDQAGTAAYTQNKAHIGGSFIKKMAGGRRKPEHFMSVGAQVGAGQNSLDVSQLWFSRQFDVANERPDFSASSGENVGTGSTGVYLDFNAGLLWYMLYGKGGFVYAGGSVQHLNQPEISILNDGKATLYTRWSGHVGGQIPVTEQFSLLPGAQAMVQGPSFETDLGVNLRYSNGDRNEVALRVGAWGRVGNRLDKGVLMDALTIVTMLELERCTVGLSYDLTTSQLRTANNRRGAFEISVSYFHPEHRRSRVQCPRL